MKLNRVAAASVSALVVLGGAGVAAAQTTPDPTTTLPDPTTTVPAPPSDTFSFTIVGLGDLSVTVDPVTGEIATVIVAPIDGVTVASPTPVHNGVQVDFTLANGTVSSVIVRAESHCAELEIILPNGRKIELHSTTPTTIDPANLPTDDDDDGDEHRGNSSSNHGSERSSEVRQDGEHRATPATPATPGSVGSPATPATPASPAPRDDSRSEDGSHSGSGSSGSSSSGSRDSRGGERD